jgi:hypothetical protein
VIGFRSESVVVVVEVASGFVIAVAVLELSLMVVWCVFEQFVCG